MEETEKVKLPRQKGEKMRIIITGAAGMLGADLVNVLKDKHELHGVDIRELTYKLPLTTYHLLDITDAQQTYNVITKINPDLVIHTAAYTDVDGCEEKPDIAYMVNGIGTRNIALACQRFDAALMYISTDYVFDGEKEKPYLEHDKPNPQSIYAKSKYWGENFTQHLLNKFYIVRTSGLFGKNGKNFVKTILNLAQEKKEIKIVKDQITSPTYTKDLAEGISRLISPVTSQNQEAISHLYGIWHITNSGFCSWYDFAKEILRITSNKLEITSISSKDLKRPAKRPKYSVLNNYCWQLQGWKLLREWKDALRDYLSQEVNK